MVSCLQVVLQWDVLSKRVAADADEIEVRCSATAAAAAVHSKFE